MAIVDILKYTLELDSSKFQGDAVKADAAVGNLANSIKGTLTGALAGLAAGFSAVKIGEFLKEATMMAAQEELMTVALQQLGRTAGYSASSLESLAGKVSALGFTMGGSRQFLMRLIQNQVDLAQATKLATVALDLTAISGRPAEEVLDTLTMSISSLMPRALKQLGMVIDMTAAEEKYAASIGRTGEALKAQPLNESERRLAMINAVLEKGTTIAGAYTAALGTAAGAMIPLGVQVTELKEKIGSLLTPALAALIPLLDRAAEGFRKLFANATERETELFTKMTSTFERQKTVLPELIKQWENLAGTTAENEMASLDLQNVQKMIERLAPGLITGYNEQGIALGLTTEALKRYIQTQKDAVGVTTNEQAFAWVTRLAELKTKIAGITESLANPDSPYTITVGVKELNRQLKEASIEASQLQELLKPKGEITIWDVLALSLSKYQSVKDAAEAKNKKASDDAIAAAKARGEAEAKAYEEASAAIDKWYIKYQIGLPVSKATDIVGNLESQYGGAGLTPDIPKLIAGLKAAIIAQAGVLGAEATKILTDALEKAKDSQRTSTKAKADQDKYYADALDAEAKLAKDKLDNIENARQAQARANVEIADSLIYAASYFFSLFDEGIASIASGLSNAISGAISGASAGGVAGLVNVIGSLSGLIPSLFASDDPVMQELVDVTQRQVATQEELISAINEWKDSLSGLTAEEKSSRSANLSSALGGLNEGNVNETIKWLADRGINAPEGASFEDLQQWLFEALQAIKAENKRFADLLEADTQQKRKDLLLTETWTDPGHSDQENGRIALQQLADMTELYGLTPEEQHELLTAIWDKYSESMSNDDKLNTKALLEGFHRDQADGSAAAEQTQVSRSIQKITERQADSLISALSTIDLHLQDGIQALINAIRSITMSFTAGAAATMEVAIINAATVNVGYMNVAGSNLSGGSTTNTKKQLVVEGRSLGKRF
jgi:hypothetical protein